MELDGIIGQDKRELSVLIEIGYLVNLLMGAIRDIRDADGQEDEDDSDALMTRAADSAAEIYFGLTGQRVTLQEKKSCLVKKLWATVVRIEPVEDEEDEDEDPLHLPELIIAMQVRGGSCDGASISAELTKEMRLAIANQEAWSKRKKRQPVRFCAYCGTKLRSGECPNVKCRAMSDDDDEE